ncbi:MAG: flagellar export chaperone FliS [Phycisphaerae bacterium]
MTNNYEQGKMEYLRTKVLTASPEELHLMLYDGAIRFAEEAKTALQEGNMEKAHDALVRTQNIVLEMSSGLNHHIDPDLCAKLSSLYNFIYRRLIEANLKREILPIEDALKILNYQRETWILLMRQLTQDHKDQSAVAAVPADEESNTSDNSFSEPGASLSLSA